MPTALIHRNSVNITQMQFADDNNMWILSESQCIRAVGSVGCSLARAAIGNGRDQSNDDAPGGRDRHTSTLMYSASLTPSLSEA